MGKKYRLHKFSINELDNPRQRAGYWRYMRHFWHWYRVYRDGMESNHLEYHVEWYLKKWGTLAGHYFSARFHTGNLGSETPFDGHIQILWFAFYWGWGGNRKLAERISRCSGYKYDTREWSLRIFDNRLWWEFANHSDMCDNRREWRKKKNGNRRRRTWRDGSVCLSVPELLLGPKRYSDETLDGHATLLRFPDGSYPVIIDLQRVRLGRTRVGKHRHVVSYSLDVDAPSGIPTHVDHSGGWKGDRTYGFGVDFTHYATAYPRDEWKQHAEAAVTAWVIHERERTGFVRPDPVEADS